MKQHQIAIEQASKRLTSLSKDRLTVMYDRALARLQKSEKKSIGVQDPFPMNVYELAFVGQGEEVVNAVRVLDIESGHYVKLVKSSKIPTVLLEIGLIVSAEEVTQGQSNIKAW